jgi:hypothetical protein
LDLIENYTAMLYLTILHPIIISNHFEATCDIFNYNIKTKWNGNLIMTDVMTPDQWKADCLMTILRIDSKLSNLIRNILFDGRKFDNAKELHKIHNRMYR